jgi:membrane protease YdiL (CAAX protease family)
MSTIERRPVWLPGHRTGRVTNVVRAHPVPAFLTLGLGLGGLLSTVALLAHHRVVPGAWLLSRLPMEVDETVGWLVMVGGMFPAALLVTYLVDGGPGVRALLGRAVAWRFPPVWWVLVVAALPLLSMAIGLTLGGTVGAPHPWTVIGRQLLLVGLTVVVVNLWEETAWAGFLQTRLGARHNVVVAALLTAVPFAAAHLPLQFVTDFTAASVALGFVALLVLCFVVRLLIGVVLRGAGGSVLAVAVLHAVFNRSNNGDGVLAALLHGVNYQVCALAAALLLAILLALVLRTRPRSFLLERT